MIFWMGNQVDLQKVQDSQLPWAPQKLHACRMSWEFQWLLGSHFPLQLTVVEVVEQSYDRKHQIGSVGQQEK